MRGGPAWVLEPKQGEERASVKGGRDPAGDQDPEHTGGVYLGCATARRGDGRRKGQSLSG